MKAKVYYVSPKGSTEKVANIIANECHIVKEPLMPAYMPEGVTLMFLGCEGKKMEKVITEFVGSITKERVVNAALFCANPASSDAAIQQMRQALTAKGVKVMDKSFICRGKGAFGKHPSDVDLEAARAFAAECVKAIFG